MCRNSLIIVSTIVLVFVCSTGASENNGTEIATRTEENVVFGRDLIEQGRTFVHHTVKRFMVLMPVIFFKLGIAFSLLLLVTLVAVNNGFIGFMLLVVGMSTVLARLQEARTPPVTPVTRIPYPVAYPSPVISHEGYHSPAHSHYGHFDRRSDLVAGYTASAGLQRVVGASGSSGALGLSGSSGSLGSLRLSGSSGTLGSLGSPGSAGLDYGGDERYTNVMYNKNSY